MKTKLFLTSLVVGLCAVLVLSCSKDDEYEDFYSLDINCHTPATRSAAEDSWVGTPEQLRSKYYEINTWYNKVQGGCGITTLVDIWIREKGKSYFEVPPSQCPKNAQQYADEVLENFGDNYNDSIGVFSSEIVKVANGGTPTGTYSLKTLNSSEKSAFFADKKNRQKVCAILLQNTNGKGHSAATTYVYPHTVYFSGFDIFNPDKNQYGYYSIPVSGSKKVNKKDGSDGGSWEIIGVYLH